MWLHVIWCDYMWYQVVNRVIWYDRVNDMHDREPWCHLFAKNVVPSSKKQSINMNGSWTQSRWLSFHIINIHPHFRLWSEGGTVAWMIEGYLKKGLVNVPILSNIGDISSPTDICFGDVKQIPKKGHLPTTGFPCPNRLGEGPRRCPWPRWNWLRRWNVAWLQGPWTWLGKRFT